jgi:hypothetical protein
MFVSVLPSGMNGGTKIQETDSMIGHITASEGLWCDSAHHDCTMPDAKNAVSRMYPVRIGAKFVRMGAITGHEWLRIRSYISGLEVKFDCSIAVDCKDALDLQRLYPSEGAAGPGGILAAFLQAIRRIASTEPVIYERYRQGILRAENRVNNLQNGVARLDVQGLHLDQAVSSLAAGDYELELCRIDRWADLHCLSEPHPFKFHWDPVHRQSRVIHNFRPGLYRLYMCQKVSAGFIRTDNYASILAVGPAAFGRLNHEFQDVVTSTQRWVADDATVGTMLQMYLQYMAFRRDISGSGKAQRASRTGVSTNGASPKN